MRYDNVNPDIFKDAEKRISNFEILSQILPPLSINYKSKLFESGEDYQNSNNVLEIKDGEYIRGHMEKGILGAGSKKVLFIASAMTSEIWLLLISSTIYKILSQTT